MFFFFFFNDTATTEIYTLSLHDALPISEDGLGGWLVKGRKSASRIGGLELRNGITAAGGLAEVEAAKLVVQDAFVTGMDIDRKSTRLNSSHSQISYAVFCLKKQTRDQRA